MGKASKAAAAWKTYQEVSKPGTPGVLARVRAIPRLIGGVMRGDYEGMGKGKLAMMALGLVYIVSPVDVIPDFLVLLGVADDFGVFLWLMASMLGESGRYVEWERKRLIGHVERPQARRLAGD
ncbi:YkvA family protein [Nonomuraea sp. NPDC003804]|uniref:YkvA family protein n=1 Tax=Nonomuraea sp. NPDC003804 TaxID=3154547 RepID=UPI0033AD1892